MTKYKIHDEQIPGRYFADGELYDSLEKIRQQLISFHEIDWSGEYNIEDSGLEFILSYGDWTIHDENDNEIPYELIRDHDAKSGRNIN